ncbi:Proteasome subunit beta [Mycena kentingensis (nom. inval.)]|nr:Proteasome subunit beta [Mycena kentingensis (nom. inval.)]
MSSLRVHRRASHVYLGDTHQIPYACAPPVDIMHAFVNRFASTATIRPLLRAHGQEDDIAGWGSQGGINAALPSFAVPNVADPIAFLQMHTDDKDPDCRIKLQHGTTTLAFIFQGGIVVAVDSRATMGDYVASGTVKKVIEINPYLLGTMAGTAADCQYWETYLGSQARLHELRNGGEDVRMGLGMGTMICGWDKTGPSIYSVSSDGSRLKGTLFSEGSGSPHAYGVLDQGYSYNMSSDAALDLARRAIYAAGHRDAYTGNSCNLYWVTEDGWHFVGNYDVSEMHYEGVADASVGGAGQPYGYELRAHGKSL